jgi:hypothetical protein
MNNTWKLPKEGGEAAQTDRYRRRGCSVPRLCDASLTFEVSVDACQWQTSVPQLEDDVSARKRVGRMRENCVMCPGYHERGGGNGGGRKCDNIVAIPWRGRGGEGLDGHMGTASVS